jgi:hypothetical protein
MGLLARVRSSDHSAIGTEITRAQPEIRKQTPRRAIFLIVTGMVVLAILVWIPPLPMGSGKTIAILDLVGYGAVLCLLHLFSFPLRKRLSMPGGPVALSLHHRISDCGLLLAVAHTAGYLVMQPLTLDYLLPTAPIYMLAGLLALVLYIVATATSLHGPRRYLFASSRWFQAVHIILATVLLFAVVLHLAGSGLFLNTLWKQTIFGALAGGAVIGVLRRGKGISRPSGTR